MNNNNNNNRNVRTYLLTYIFADVFQGQSLTDSKVRLSAYHALSSPAYISQTAQDPILEAFQLYKELYDWSNYEPEFRKDYLDLAQRCSDYAVALLGHCRRREEASCSSSSSSSCSNNNNNNNNNSNWYISSSVCF